MDRDELIEKAGIYHNLTFSNGGCYRPTNGTEPLITHFLADFALEILESQAVQFADNITANKEAHREGYEAGRRAERERIADEIDRRVKIDVANADWRQIANYPDELRQTEPAESGE